MAGFSRYICHSHGARVTEDQTPAGHQRNGQDDGRRHRVLEAVESTQAKVIARVLVPLLLTALLGVSGFFGARLLRQLDSQGDDIAQVKSDMRVLSTRFDEVALRNVESNTARIGQGEKKDVEQDRRIDALERTVKTP